MTKKKLARVMAEAYDKYGQSTTAKIAAVGRMDKNTTGLLLFTNDTDMIRKFSLPVKLFHMFVKDFLMVIFECNFD